MPAPSNCIGQGIPIVNAVPTLTGSIRLTNTQDANVNLYVLNTKAGSSVVRCSDAGTVFTFEADPKNPLHFYAYIAVSGKANLYLTSTGMGHLTMENFNSGAGQSWYLYSQTNTGSYLIEAPYSNTCGYLAAVDTSSVSTTPPAAGYANQWWEIV